MTATATIGMQLRLETEIHEALARVAPKNKTAYIKRLIRRDLERRGELPKEPTARRGR